MRKVLACIFLLLAFSGCMRYRLNDRQTMRYFKRKGLAPIIKRETTQGTIRYLEVGEHQETVLFFIHGAPSSMAIFKTLLSDTALLNRAKIVAVDRAGYGYSEHGHSVTSIVEQARRLAPVLQKYLHYKRVILVGTSYGGSVAARLAMEYPEQIDDILFISSSLAPKEETIYSISYMIRRRAFRWLFPTFVRVANDEKLAHREALEEILPDWNKIQANVVALHGEADKLIYPANVLFAKQKLVQAKGFREVWIPKMGHKISYAHPEIIHRVLLEMLK